jgi:DTW domain-containing protein
MNAVQRLYQYRKSLSTTVYKSRGQRVIRCNKCCLAQQHCICDIAPEKQIARKSNAGFLLLMYDTEVFKPSNTGKLIADVIPDTYAFLWSRTVENPELLAVINDPKWQPYVVFPAQYAQENREVVQQHVVCEPVKRPLFIMLDGSWREAKKMFRKSPYLDKFPMVAFDPHVFEVAKGCESITAEVNTVQKNASGQCDENQPRYHLRVSSGTNQFSTAEVSARVLAMAGEPMNATLLDLWFDLFSYQYQKSVCRSNQGNPNAQALYQAYIEQTFLKVE